MEENYVNSNLIGKEIPMSVQELLDFKEPRKFICSVGGDIYIFQCLGYSSSSTSFTLVLHQLDDNTKGMFMRLKYDTSIRKLIVSSISFTVHNNTKYNITLNKPSSMYGVNYSIRMSIDHVVFLIIPPNSIKNSSNIANTFNGCRPIKLINKG